ncbi:MAG: transposase family protein [Intrasporangium sp.]|uniref:transposase family protein n=1 Tax=Intrasporangium sp. TaxID=1925024 RepID=UPI002647A092|nr:transposase family protein [Intrasporangium sp.]MDN5795780.1 transposase family protein [Intrasporangium sp.]
MPSSPIIPAAAQPDRDDRLLDLLATVPDPRDPRGVRYPLAGMLAVAACAVLAGAPLVRRDRRVGRRPAP